MLINRHNKLKVSSILGWLSLEYKSELDFDRSENVANDDEGQFCK